MVNLFIWLWFVISWAITETLLNPCGGKHRMPTSAQGGYGDLANPPRRVFSPCSLFKVAPPHDSAWTHNSCSAPAEGRAASAFCPTICKCFPCPPDLTELHLSTRTAPQARCAAPRRGRGERCFKKKKKWKKWRLRKNGTVHGAKDGKQFSVGRTGEKSRREEIESPLPLIWAVFITSAGRHSHIAFHSLPHPWLQVNGKGNFLSARVHTAPFLTDKLYFGSTQKWGHSSPSQLASARFCGKSHWSH